MADKKTLLTLSEAVRKRLGKQKNQSALVDALLAKYFGLDFPHDGTAVSDVRREILNNLPAFTPPPPGLKIREMGREVVPEPEAPVVATMEPESVTSLRYCPQGHVMLTGFCLTCDL